MFILPPSLIKSPLEMIAYRYPSLSSIFGRSSQISQRGIQLQYSALNLDILDYQDAGCMSNIIIGSIILWEGRI